ncbi:MAG: hypothetical protein K9L75_01195 [Spirochaetia bacterium]|nr:hypothetical protein [Spirochaetia bacterium]
MDFFISSIISCIIISGAGSAEIDGEFIRYQQYDSSCGFAAIATYLSCCWDLSIDEKDLLDDFFNFSEELEKENTKQTYAQTYAITFSDMKTILFEQGFAAMGFKQNFSELQGSLQRYGPVIIYEKTEQGHFSVVIDILPIHESGPIHERGQVVILADPDTGIEYYSKEEFSSFWEGFSLLAKPFDQDTHTQKSPIKLRKKYEYFKTFTRAFYNSL